LLQDLIKQKRDIKGKYYTKTAREILELLESAERNAEFKGLDTSNLVIHASAHKGFTFRRPRSLKRSGERRKIANIQIVLSH
jgi:large subunit ribosomal protein L22